MTTVDELITQRPSFAAMEPACQTAATRINDFIYMSCGTSNSYMVKTAAGRVIINTGMGFEALIHKKLFDKIYPGPTRYILLTQGHVDHVGGVNHFRDDSTQLVAQQNNLACQKDDERIATVRISQAYIWFKKTIDKSVAAITQNPDLLIQDRPKPDLLFEDSHAFTFGGIDFELISTPGGETIDSTVIWLPQYRILFSGNVFGPLFPHFPNLNTIRGDKYRFAEPYLEAISAVRALKPAMLITGHFDPIIGEELIDASLQRMHDAVDYVHRETLKGMNDGKSIDDLMRSTSLPPELNIGQGYGKVSWAVRTIWESYMGWFKAHSTTELYPTRHTEIYADLVALAGTEAVIEKGRQALNAADPERALHFAEAALASDAGQRAALQLAIGAHQALLERSQRSNFWETGWLEYQLGLLNARLQDKPA
ncbi:MAG: alkyl sulfatase BDS1-like metallo-beta-lactamase superfamily hydrolase [Bacteroidia bacterium]|jgi:alkyl sulfatase BDS1-like metallo-beta-lactamase superfamily hydrolase